jgi:hypothetical protein
VTGPAHDVALVHSIHRGLGRKSSAKTVAAEWVSGTLRSLLQDPAADRILVQTVMRNPVMTVDRSKHRP